MKTTTMTATTAKHSEQGAALIVMLALMTLMTITLLAVAPSIQQQVQRQREAEEIRRGEEVAEAIRQYVEYYRGTKLPNNMDDLLEGLPQGTKKRQILRPSAAIDLFSDDGKWRLVQVTSPSLRNFSRRVQIFFDGSLPSNPEPQRVFDQFSISALVNVADFDNEEDSTGAADETDDTTEDSTDNVPFIGVVSGSKSKSVLAYYGIENHSKWIFTPLFRGSNVRAISGGRNGSVETEGGGGIKQNTRDIRDQQ
jgi:type II secretory pathway pseudopilin PulG